MFVQHGYTIVCVKEVWSVLLKRANFLFVYPYYFHDFMQYFIVSLQFIVSWYYISE